MNLQVIANNIRYHRERKGLLQKELAKKAFMSKASVSHYEMGLVCPPIEVLTRIAKVMDIHIFDLLEGVQP